jgi:hypothetical protein
MNELISDCRLPIADLQRVLSSNRQSAIVNRKSKACAVFKSAIGNRQSEIEGVTDGDSL